MKVVIYEFGIDHVKFFFWSVNEFEKLRQFFIPRGWEDDFFDTAEVDPQPQGGNQRRQRSHKSKGHHYNNKDTTRNVKLGSKKKRRHENSELITQLIKNFSNDC